MCHCSRRNKRLFCAAQALLAAQIPPRLNSEQCGIAWRPFLECRKQWHTSKEQSKCPLAESPADI